ncbi:MAG: winged helix-turn-helix domain-containing protein [Xanthomonadaceae bacterium]|nr:winged helix-turn-helix domain-containing protein [Xanthomonadaceae bacterium]MDE1964340.1 winged helix-turn-helix transcriptional regulator [Xanthomonadaceae bacterium]
MSGIKGHPSAAVKRQIAAASHRDIDAPATEVPRPASGWTFFSNHAHVLFCLSAEPTMLLKDVAVRVGVTERAVLRIVAELEDAGVLQRQREGRRNRYAVIPGARLRHAVESHCTVGELLAVINRR